MEKENRPMVLLTADLHRQLKVYAAEHGTTTKALVNEAVEKLLREKGGKRKTD